jgi:hypothetical protein
MVSRRCDSHCYLEYVAVIDATITVLLEIDTSISSSLACLH